MSEQRLRVNAESVVYEEVDGEVIAIDLSGGCYYSLSGCGPAIWDLLSRGATEAEICAALASRFDAGAETIRAEVSALLEQLLESGLLVSTDERVNGQLGGEGEGEKTAFEPPRFERYSDMKDYFLLDPIHEVDPAGWPKPAA